LDENVRPDIRPCPHLPTDAAVRLHGRISLHSPSPPPSPSLCCPRRREKKTILFLFFIKKIFLVVVAGLEREKIYNLQFSVFGFQSPKSPNSAGFAGEAARRRRFFRPSSPSHPFKLYSSLGWLNSKVPKPFPPFSLRLIDVDGF
jgi:hypothetical protein